MSYKNIHFWAKTTSENKPGVSVYDHMLDVGFVAKYLAIYSNVMLKRFRLTPETIGLLAGLHDIGKISPGFQRKCAVWLKDNKIDKVERNSCWDTAMESDHCKISHAVIQQFLIKKGFNRLTSKFVAAAIAGHHGRLTPPSDRGDQPPKAISETVSGIDWNAERDQNAEMVWSQFGRCNSDLALDVDSPSLWWLAGLISVADWIGSNEIFFPSEKRNNNRNVSNIARNAIDTIGFQKNELIRDLSFHDLFHDKKYPDITWVPNDMQKKAVYTITNPGVYVIEAPMGTGKTEAALWAAYQLLVSEKATGIYFALPTRATSNRIHLRLNDFLERMTLKAGESRLIHGNSWLMDTACYISLSATDPNSKVSEDARMGRDWFNSTKRALLAPFGVGTIDQALLGVVAAKHFFVRHFALAGKVVILDEIHSYDLYTGTLIDKLIATLEGLGCTVIILTATLTEKRRRQILSLPENLSDNKQPYPMLSGRKDENLFKPVTPEAPESQRITIDFIGMKEATREAVALAKKGGAVLWICNTIDTAQKQYKTFMEQSKEDFPIGLLHSRFPFKRREELESEWMLRFGKDGDKRCGSILVSTQVVEQSVDLDADLMITELAPTDMILQRLGRLWRHKRENRPINMARLCVIKENFSLEALRVMDSKTIVRSLGKKAYVYAPYILLRSLEVWENQEGEISIPSQIRSLLEMTYIGRDEPEPWQELSDEWFGTDSAKK
ncbi:MAG: CRISPR-associated helicase Cas3', partial [Candidatus Marinimicrobia bacterium]|nr:CRISPR-associated helicase Cas3' [Candidatus Neomarinimicrobiota bacterium]